MILAREHRQRPVRVNADKPGALEEVWVELDRVRDAKIQRRQKLPVIRLEYQSGRPRYTFQNEKAKDLFIKRLEIYDECRYTGKPLPRRQKDAWLTTEARFQFGSYVSI